MSIFQVSYVKETKMVELVDIDFDTVEFLVRLNVFIVMKEGK